MLSLIGLVVGLGILIYLSLRGITLFITAPLCALIVAVTGGVDILSVGHTENFVRGYSAGFATFFRDWFFMFLLGSLFGKLMGTSGAADSLSLWTVKKLGRKYAALSVVAACAILTYGGVSLFVVAFSVYPMACSIFRDANIPHRFIPAALAFGSVTFTMTSAGSPEIQNWIPIKYLGTSPYAAWEVSLIVAVFMAVVGYYWLNSMIKKAQANGESYHSPKGETADISKELTDEDIKALPHPVTGLIPLLIVLLTAFLVHGVLRENALTVSLLAGCLALALINFHQVKDHMLEVFDDGSYGALMAIANTSAVVGFAAVVKLSPAFDLIVSVVTHMEGNELISSAIAITTVAAITGSASGGQTIALPELAPHYLGEGVDPEHLHRVAAISSGMLDSMPHSGYIVTTIRVICKETHQAAYWPLFWVTTVVPIFGLILALGLISLGL